MGDFDPATSGGVWVAIRDPGTKAYLRELSKEFQVSTNAVREELNQLTKTRLLTSEKNGRNVFYRANDKHPLFPELCSMVSKVMGLDQVIESILTRLGDLEKAFLIDDYAEGKDTGIIDLVLVGDIDQYHLNDLTRKTERYIKRENPNADADRGRISGIQGGPPGPSAFSGLGERKSLSLQSGESQVTRKSPQYFWDLIPSWALSGKNLVATRVV